MVFVLVLTVAVNVVAVAARPIVDGYLGTYKVETNEENLKKYQENGENIANQIEAEGIVMVQNENNTLPLAKDNKKVNVFGWASTAWLGLGSGSVQINSVQTDFLGALKNYGISYNTELTDMYEKLMAERPFSNALSTYSTQMCRLYEPDISDTGYYTEKMLQNDFL